MKMKMMVQKMMAYYYPGGEHFPLETFPPGKWWTMNTPLKIVDWEVLEEGGMLSKYPPDEWLIKCVNTLIENSNQENKINIVMPKMSLQCRLFPNEIRKF